VLDNDIQDVYHMDNNDGNDNCNGNGGGLSNVGGYGGGHRKGSNEKRASLLPSAPSAPSSPIYSPPPPPPVVAIDSHPDTGIVLVVCPNGNICTFKPTLVNEVKDVPIVEEIDTTIINSNNSNDNDNNIVTTGNSNGNGKKMKKKKANRKNNKRNMKNK